MEREDRAAASKRHSERVIGFAVASLVAPFVTLVAVMGINSVAGPAAGFSIPSNFGQALGILALGVLLLVAGSLAFGYLGSALLLGLTFGLLAVLMANRGKLGVWHLVVAGALAGGLHVGLAYWSTEGWTKGTSAVLGTWLLRRELENGRAVVALAPLIGGAVAGLVAARMGWAKRPTR